MTEKISLTCPNCNASGSIDTTKIPRGRRLNCPKCGQDFDLPKEALPPKPPQVEEGQAITRGSDNFKPPSPPPPPPPTSLPPNERYEDRDFGSKRIPFVFTGKAGEYFKIWIVNISLTLLTLGIYSAWAKVRKNRYLYGNTMLAGSSFEYLAEPGRILKGRLIVFALFAAYSGVTYAAPLFEPLFGLIIAGFFPWLAIKSMQFRTRNTSYRNIRFNFDSAYSESAIVFIGYGFLTAITLGLAYPSLVFKRKGFVIKNSRYGTTPFEFSAHVGGFFKTYGKGLLIMLLFSAIVGLFLAVFVTRIKDLLAIKLFAIYLPVLLIFGYFIAFVYIKTRIDNMTMSSVSIGRSRIESTLKLKEMAWIYFTNIVGIILTLGLLIPWAIIRTKKYRAEHLYLIVGEDFENFVVDEKERVGSLGEEAVDFLDFDIGL